jgi:perosamine synthetase
VHIAGLPADLERIAEIARRHSLPIIDDAAHAFPAKLHGRMVGRISDVTCFSFYATKPITTGEGGMICTDDRTLADRCRLTALHGIGRNAWNRYHADGSWYYEITTPGFKYNMTDLAAAIGLAQLRKADRMWRRRREIAVSYHAVFSQFAELRCPSDSVCVQHAWHLYMLRFNRHRLSIDRNQFIEELKRRNIGSSVHFIPLHLHPYYRHVYGYKPDDFPVARREFEREISLPIYSKMNDADVQDVINAVVDIVQQFRC